MYVSYKNISLKYLKIKDYFILCLIHVTRFMLKKEFLEDTRKNTRFALKSAFY